MKRFGLFIFALFVCVIAVADTVNINWENGDTTFAQTTCTIGGDLNVPSTNPTKRGYNFVGWDVRAAKELEYIGMDQSQYFDTGIKFDSDEIEYETKAQFTRNYSVLFGADGTCSGSTKINNSSGSMFLTATYTSLAFITGKNYGNNNNIFYTSIERGSINTCGIYIKKSTNFETVTINDTVINRNFSGTITTDKNIFIGHIGDTSSCGFWGNLYYFRIKKDGVLVRDFIPALDPDGIASLYDRVSQTFFYNQTETDITAGPIKVY